MSGLGLLLFLLVGVALLGTGLPAFAVLIFGALIGAAASVAFGDVAAAVYTVLPGRVLSLLENDLLQALPLFVFMGVLMEELGLAPMLLGLVSRRSGRAHPPIVSGMGLGALLGPMNGSVSASVLALARSVEPRLAAAGVPPAIRLATIAVAGTFGIVVPPSLVLILLGDAMMAAHTIAVNTAGRSDMIVNTQDVFRGALPPAAIYFAACLGIAVLLSHQLKATGSEATTPPAMPAGARLLALLALAGIALLLAGVALGLLYAVEAAATGTTALLAVGVVSGRLTSASLDRVLTETMRATGALIAPLLAATTFTLVLRTLGTDKLVASWLAALPGGELAAVLVVLAGTGVSALVLDAFEIIFVVVPTVVPPLLVKVPDAVWVSTLVMLTLQASFLMPPAGYALLMARSSIKEPLPLAAAARALLPFVAAQLAVLALVLAEPRLVHLLTSKGKQIERTGTAPLNASSPRNDVTAPPPTFDGGGISFGSKPSFD